MRKDFILSISRKYLGLMLVIASLLFIASTNASNNVTSPSSRSGSVVTFLSPKHVPASTSTTVSSNGVENTNVDRSTPSNTSVDVWSNNPSASVSENAVTPAPLPSPAPAPSDTPTTTPSETYVPPANDNPEPYTPPPSPCSSCRPPMYNNNGPQMMCPQYMACMY